MKNPSTQHATHSQLLRRIEFARRGDRSSIGALLDLYRSYLNVLARTQLDPRLQCRVGISDLVQETMLAAHRDFGAFRGNSEAELLAWLRSVLGHCLSHMMDKHLFAQKRDLRREVRVDRGANASRNSAAKLADAFVDQGRSPSQIAEQRESADRLFEKLRMLKPRDRDLILYRNLHGLSFKEISERTETKIGTVRMQWTRAIAKFKALCDQECSSETTHQDRP